MITKNPRINVAFEKMTVGLLARLAHKENKSISSIVRELTVSALKMHEDLYLSKVAEKLDQKDAQKYEHFEAWK